ncbi:MAG TPA: universal stress protein [Chloroflexota bacterium]|nr:universal stress protein [Chloroflexota bacterium]
MIKQILVPLDGSVLAERALPYAEQLAQGSGATLHLVRVVDVLAQANLALAPVSVPEDAYEAALQEATTYLAAQRDRLMAAGLAVQTATPAAEVGAALLAYEREARDRSGRAVQPWTPWPGPAGPGLGSGASAARR